MTNNKLLPVSALAACITLTVGPALAQYTREPNRYTDPTSGEVLEYNIVRPNGYDQNAATKYPLLVCLHAASDVNPPNRTLSADGNCWVGSLNTTANQATYPSFYMMPISQTNSSGWGDAGPNNPITQTQKFEGRLTVVVVRELLTRFKIDADRLYITGPSMGGRGTWDIIRRNPTLFAAAAPMAAPASAADAVLYASQNIWSVNGENDSTVGDNRDAIAGIRAAGGNPIYTELANHGHDSWRSVYPMAEFMAWMFAQRRGVPWWTHPPAAPTSVPGATLSQPVVVPPAGIGGMSGFPGAGGMSGSPSRGGEGGVAGASGGGLSGGGQSGATAQGGAGSGGVPTSGAPGTSGLGGQSAAGSGGVPVGAAGAGAGAGMTDEPSSEPAAPDKDGGCSVTNRSTATRTRAGSLIFMMLAAFAARRRSYVKKRRSSGGKPPGSRFTAERLRAREIVQCPSPLRRPRCP